MKGEGGPHRVKYAKTGFLLTYEVILLGRSYKKSYEVILFGLFL